MLVIQNGRADFLMKGLIDTKLILKKVLDKKYGFRKSNRMTHATLVESAFYHKPFLLSDAAMNIDQSFETKIEIIKNGVGLLHKLGINQAKVAVLSAVEKTNEKLESTLIAQQLKELILYPYKEELSDFVDYPDNAGGVWRFNTQPTKQWLRNNFKRVLAK